MFMQLTRPFRRSFGGIGLVMAALALISHFALAPTVLPATDEARAVAEIDALAILCNQPAPHHHHDRAPHPTSGRDCVCPLSVSASLHAVILGAAPKLPAPVILVAGMLAVLPPAHAPPRPALLQPYPTGPPVLL